MRSSMLKRLIAVVTLFSTVLITMPVSAAELGAPRPSVGAVTGVGTVSLRGVSVPQEGTIFSGDELQVGAQGYAKIMLVAGHRLELDRDTKIAIQQTGKNVVVQIKTGNVAFTSAATSQLTLQVGPYEIVPQPNAAGNAALVGKDALGLRTIRGKIAVQSTASSAVSYVVSAGQERILTFAGQMRQPIAQLASNMPGPIPALPPVPDPAPQTAPAGRGLSKAGWLAILATIGGATAAIAVLATSGTTENVSAILAKQQAAQAAQQAQQATQQAQAAAQAQAQAATTANAQLAALPPSTQTQLATQIQNFQAISSQAQATLQQIANLSGPLAAAAQAVQSATPGTPAYNTAVTNYNTLAAQFNNLVAQAQQQQAAYNQAAQLLNTGAANAGATLKIPSLQNTLLTAPTINTSVSPSVPS